MTPAVMILAGLTAIFLIAAAIMAAKRNAEQRTAALIAEAERLGWGFKKEVSYDMIPNLDRFELFRTGHSKKLRNLLTSPPGDPRGVVFEYQYTTGAGKSQATHRQSVFYATSADFTLPAFSLRPEHFFHRVAGAFGYQDIDLESRPEFSRMFLLRGDNDSAVRSAFTDDVATFFEQRPRACAAGGGRELLYWRPGKVAKAEDLEAFITDGFDLAARMRESVRRPA
jgi:hypothetical protein